MILRKIIALFATCHILLILIYFIICLRTPSLLNFIILFAIIYLFPIAIFRVQDYFCPLKEGRFDFQTKAYCPWWGAHQIQQVYAAVPHLEGLLRIIPGAYSFWLRLWGAKIGKQVYWTPRVEIIDRMLLEVGDYTIFGHLAACCCHLIGTKNNQLILSVGKVRIGKQVMVGAGSRLGPGTIISDKINIPVCTDLLLDQHVQNQNQMKKNHYDPLQRQVEPASN